MKKKNGRPPKYSQKEEFLNLFNGYEEESKAKGEILTKAGWLHYLGISRETYSTYKKTKKFLDTLKQIELVIENRWNQALAGKQAAGPIFYLKNAFKEEYKDHSEIDQNIRLPKPISDVVKDAKHKP